MLTTELWTLFGCSIVLALSIIIQAIHLDFYAGIKYTLGNRDSEPIKLNAIGKRLARNVVNQVEGLAMFAPLIFITEIAGIHSKLSTYGAVLFFITRVVYMISFVFGITIIRSIVWMIGMCGLGSIAVNILMTAI